MHALTENETWDLVDAPKGVRPIGCWWVYKVKYNTDKKGLHATKQHRLPRDLRLVSKITIVCVLLGIVAAKGWHLHHMDVKNEFLQGELEERCTWCNTPPDFSSERAVRLYAD